MEAYDRIELTYFPLWALVTVIIAFLFGHRLGSPILHMMNWLKNLSNGKLQEPKDKRGRPASRSGEGRLRETLPGIPGGDPVSGFFDPDP